MIVRRNHHFGIKPSDALPKGQTMIEFSFSMIICAVLLFAMIKVFVWTGKELAGRRRAHEASLTDPASGPEKQIRPTFYYSTRFNAAVDSNIYAH